jgi:uncharacterized damage-inducible protein DinB
MDRSDLQTLLDYHYWARDRMLAAVAGLTPEQYTRDMGGSFKSVRDTLVHLYAAEWAWYSRWHGTSPAALLPAEQFPDLDSLRTAWIDHERKMRAYVESLDDPTVHKTIEYRFLSGQPAATVLWQMLQHVVNHGSYHRGQVTTMLRQLGAAPPKSMDMIEYYRKRAAAAGDERRQS